MIKTMKDHKAMILTVVAVYFAVFMLCTANVQAADTSAYASIFNAEYYASANADVKAVYGTDANALFNHFVNYGMKEGRRASAEFDVKYYRANNADLNAAFGDNLTLYYMHYMNYGKAEGRKGAGNATTSQTTQATQQSQTTQTTQTTASGYKNLSPYAPDAVEFVNALNAFRVAHGKNALVLLDVNGGAWEDEYYDTLGGSETLLPFMLSKTDAEVGIYFRTVNYFGASESGTCYTYKGQCFDKNLVMANGRSTFSNFLSDGEYIVLSRCYYNDTGYNVDAYLFVK